MKRLVLLSLVAIITISCKEKTEEVVAESVAEPEAEVLQVESAIATFDYEGITPLLHKNNDTTYVVNFWATWCKPCVKELPAFEQLGETYQGDKVKVLLVSLDFPDQVEKRVLPFIEKQALKSHVVLLDDPDANSWIPKIAEEWSGAIPATIIYKGSDRKFYERSFTYEELESELKTIL